MFECFVGGVQTVDAFVRETNIGIGITNIITSAGVNTVAGIGTIKIPVGTTNYPVSKSHTVYTDVDHGLNPVTQLTAVNTGISAAQRGLNYGTGSGTEAVFYNAKLVNSQELNWHLGVGIGTTTGSGATAKVTVSGIGSITELIIMNGGSAYGIGNTLYVVGIATQTGWVPAKYNVAKIYGYNPAGSNSSWVQGNLQITSAQLGTKLNDNWTVEFMIYKDSTNSGAHRERSAS